MISLSELYHHAEDATHEVLVSGFREAFDDCNRIIANADRRAEHMRQQVAEAQHRAAAASQALVDMHLNSVQIASNIEQEASLCRL